jgi:hypothetical protein
MSTAVATSPSQLCFPWMQSESPTSRTKSSPHHRARNTKNQAIREQSREAQEQSPVNSAASIPAVIQGEMDSKIEKVVVRTASANTLAPRDGMRVGQVRIGSVMLSLLKKYGITDQEISDVLATIAQEKCQSLAS